ncbi:hypothetical protein QE152_g26961 [Popillia japonica]|uniref:Uncharacterized protein n=1 Tax=Popillia japonica TaxID=7064 RepID=A0AAW1JXT0_POPJA
MPIRTDSSLTANLVLLCLGILKGVLGLFCSSKIGMLGMNVLVDLPRPMTHYHEGELSGMDVIYDIGGWPIHPQTGERIRPLSRKTEFCMNVVFFLTYPFLMLITACSFCCYKTYDEEEVDNQEYENVNTVVFSECPRSQVKECKDKSKLCRGSCVQRDIYKDEDSAEEADTKNGIAVF